jgi:D-alanine-D-alanine ligase
MEVALVANLKQNAPTWSEMPSEQWHDLDSWETIQSITIALEKCGHRVTFLEGDKSLYNNLDAVKDICFNLCRGHFGDSRAAQIPAILELLRIPYTGSPVLTLALAENKAMTRRLLSYHGLPTPAFQVFEHEDEALNAGLQLPLRVQSSGAETESDIRVEAVVLDQSQLRTRLQQVLDRYHQPALVEQSIEGRRITMGIVGNLTSPIARQIPDDETADRIFRGLHIFLPLEVSPATAPTAKTVLNTNKTSLDLDHQDPGPALLPENRVEDLKWLAAIAFRVMGCLDVACIDFQLDNNDNDKPYILNVNPLPSLSPDLSALYLAAMADNWTYDKLINHILDEASHRHQIEASNNPSLKMLDYEAAVPVSTSG